MADRSKKLWADGYGDIPLGAAFRDYGGSFTKRSARIRCTQIQQDVLASIRQRFTYTILV